MLFTMDEQVHHFKVTGEISPSDLGVLRKSFFQFLESNPEFLVLDLSEVTLQVPDFELQTVLTEIKTLASSKALHLQIAQSDIEARVATQSVLEDALSRQVDALKAKIELREEMKRNLEKIIDSNRALKEAISERSSQLQTGSSQKNPFHPLIDRLWSEK